MWNPVALDSSVCAVCSSGDGPFWIGPSMPTDRLAPFGGLVRARLHICKTCMFVAIDGEDSPYAGRLRFADDAEEKMGRLSRENIGLALELQEARPRLALLDDLLTAANRHLATQAHVPEPVA